MKKKDKISCIIANEDIAERPYFLKNKEWYYHDGRIYQLTSKAPQKAIDSYNKLYELKIDDDDNIYYI